jgi:hypothetical protein
MRVTLGMCSRTNDRMSFGTSSPQKRVAARPGTAASDASAAGTAWRSTVAQPAAIVAIKQPALKRNTLERRNAKPPRD